MQRAGLQSHEKVGIDEIINAWLQKGFIAQPPDLLILTIALLYQFLICLMQLAIFFPQGFQFLCGLWSLVPRLRYFLKN